ncbi:LysM peptidoglycan-binding domain-containing protein [Hyalangium rubrum]|uniref:LysM peptidoglycan-binding domain-containing protein n=1 Tax=Hyalangium rubrum TaxID=3103134 RepID=A0ABU5HBW2_9BACT|nr:LysM peptidoglycan-binding domain-containing protein [Hyalangium sp. s54d21]MDY7229570.1 LysM peptidoglycan-binding domain-containing protein [Hyalangium sp. s54d21]
MQTNNSVRRPTDHSVQRGDTLTKLAKKYGTTVDALVQKNNISNPNLIRVGQKLIIPDGFDRPTNRPATSPPGMPGSSTGSPSSAAPTGGTAPVAGATGGNGQGVTAAQLRQIMPNLSQAKADEYLPHINRAMQEAGINTKQRQAMFLAQLAHESGGLRYMEEIASGAAYEGRRDLGNTQPGDGTRFKGRGPIQLTGRSNYAAAGRDLGIDLVNNPQRAAQPDVGFRVAAWYWNTRGLNTHADQGNFREVTRRINGGYNGLADREAYYRRALAAL